MTTPPELPEEPRIQPSTGKVRPQNIPPIDGVVEPTFWEGLDVNSVGSSSETLPEVEQSEATYQYQREQREQESQA